MIIWQKYVGDLSMDPVFMICKFCKMLWNLHIMTVPEKRDPDLAARPHVIVGRVL